MQILEPHSPEWFAALEEKDPHQAGLVRGLIALAGTKEVCSLCGDMPAKDYVRDHSGESLKLCADCRTDQEALWKRSFIPLAQGASTNGRN